MEAVIRQLERARRRGRTLLLAQRVSEAVLLLLGAWAGLALIDYVVRFPGWLRLLLGVGVLVAIGQWVVRRVTRAAAFRPALGEVALRAERLFPQLAGALATGVELSLSTASHSADHGMTALAIRRAEQRVGDADLKGLIDPTRTWRVGALTLLSLALVVLLAVTIPNHARAAAMRWIAPLGDAEWPKRTELRSTVTVAAWPSDLPVPLGAEVTRGFTSGMRVTAWYRVVDSSAEVQPQWQRVLLNEQPPRASNPGVGRFELLVDLHRSSLLASTASRTLEVRFEAGDDDTDVQEVALVPRPAVRSFVAELVPPEYAAGLVGPRRVALHESPASVVTEQALVGSKLTLELTFNKPLPNLASLQLAEWAPGLASVGNLEITHASDGTGVRLAWRLDDSAESELRLTDAYGITNQSDRVYRFSAQPDDPPAVTLTEPASEMSVLASARVPVRGVADDDVGLERVALHAEVEDDGSTDTGNPDPMVLAERAARTGSAEIETRFDLAPLDLEPGMVVGLSAVAEDVFELDGTRHAPVRSAVRRLRIIDELQLISQVRGELAALRQRVIRTAQQQDRLTEEPEPSANDQGRIGQRLDSQSATVEQLAERVAMNRLSDPTLEQLLELSDGLLSQAAQQSARAHQELTAGDRESAKDAQAAASEKMRELIELLDQGRDALTLQIQLGELRAALDALAQDTRKLLPQTIGRSADELSEELKEAIEELAEREAALADQADALVRRMVSSADALARQGQSDREQATAAALAEAAAIARREGLTPRLEQGAEAIQRNQLAEASRSQTQAGQTIDRMMSELGTQQRRMTEMLRRRLQELAEAIERLIQRQAEQIDLLEAAEQLPPLEGGQTTVRRSTIAVEERARASGQADAVADELGSAVDEQARAVQGLRRPDRATASAAEAAALAHLESALEIIREKQAAEQAAAAQQERAALRAAYTELADRQDALREQTAALIEAGPLDRKRRGEMRTLGQQEEQLRTDADALRSEVEGQIIFEAMHSRVDRTAGGVVTALREGRSQRSLLRDQVTVATTLRTMADALEDPPDDDRFEEGGGGSGGGGGGAGQTQVVPPLAELRLLRGMQQHVYDATRALSEADLPTDETESRLRELSTQQQELATLGELMVERMQMQQGAP